MYSLLISFTITHEVILEHGLRSVFHVVIVHKWPKSGSKFQRSQHRFCRSYSIRLIVWELQNLGQDLELETELKGP